MTFLTHTDRALKQAALETLEHRRLMSTVTFEGGILTIQADGGDGSTVSIGTNDNGRKIWAVADSVARSVNVNAVKEIRIVGTAYSDKIVVDPGVKIGVYVDAGAGNDTVQTGAGHDTVLGGDGNDSISTGDGHDSIAGGNGNDFIDAGGGHDKATGEAGNDSIDGGAGNDALDAGDGDDAVYGNDGNDNILAGDGDDTVHGGAGNDFVHGGAGNNHLTGSPGNDTVIETPTSQPEPSDPDPVDPDPVDPDPVDPDPVDPDPVDPDPVDPDPVDPDPVDPEPVDPDPVDPEPNEPEPTDPGTTDPNNGGGTTDPGETTDPEPVVSPVQPVIRVISSTITAGQVVHVHGIDSILGEGQSPLYAKYEWDFGDANSKYNKLTGFNAGHLYTKAGTYTVKLTVTNADGKSSTVEMQVTVAADTRRTIYVSPSGNDANSGLAPDQAVKSWDRAKALLGPDTRVLFERGGSYAVGSTMIVKYSNVEIGAYGEGARPILNGANLQGHFIDTPKEQRDIMIRDLFFYTPHAAVNGIANNVAASGIDIGGKNIAVVGCMFENISNAIHANRRPEGVYVADNAIPSDTGLRSNFMWAEGSDYVILGNQVANSTREHIIRSGDTGTHRMLIAFNDFSNLDRRAATGDTADYAKCTIRLQQGAWAWVAENELHGPMAVSSGGTLDAHGNWDWAVVRNNSVYDSFVDLWPGADHLLFADNKFYSERSDWNPAVYNWAINARPLNRPITDVHVINNEYRGSLLFGEWQGISGLVTGGNTLLAA